jgi:hypothetical protein
LSMDKWEDNDWQTQTTAIHSTDDVLLVHKYHHPTKWYVRCKHRSPYSYFRC